LQAGGAGVGASGRAPPTHDGLLKLLAHPPPTQQPASELKFHTPQLLSLQQASLHSAAVAATSRLQ
jgi:hypothetical protein